MGSNIRSNILDELIVLHVITNDYVCAMTPASLQTSLTSGLSLWRSYGLETLWNYRCQDATLVALPVQGVSDCQISSVGGLLKNRLGRLVLIGARVIEWTSQSADRSDREISLWLSGYGAGLVSSRSYGRAVSNVTVVATLMARPVRCVNLRVCDC